MGASNVDYCTIKIDIIPQSILTSHCQRSHGYSHQSSPVTALLLSEHASTTCTQYKISIVSQQI
jgi:hypothetical protein